MSDKLFSNLDELLEDVPVGGSRHLVLADGETVLMRIRSSYGTFAIVYHLVPEIPGSDETYSLEGSRALKVFLSHWLETRIGQRYPCLTIRSSREPEVPLATASESAESAYIRYTVIRRAGLYNPAYGDARVCTCGHPYYRHFDTYEHMAPVSCKYCGCGEFNEATAANT